MPRVLFDFVESNIEILLTAVIKARDANSQFTRKFMMKFAL